MMNERTLQTREETILHHRERLNAALLYIQENLDAALTIEALAAVAGFSPFYFHRVFAAYLQETVSDYVRRIRLEWAARRLIFSGEPVTQIALAAGYETPAAFGRAFKRRFNASPRSFRARRRPALYASNWEPLLLQPEFRRRPGHALAYIPCVGAEAESEAVWNMLRQHPGIADGGGAPVFNRQESPSYVQVCRDRPDDGITAREKMRVDVGILLDESASIQPRGRVGVQHLAGGVYAVFHHRGRRREAMWQAIYKRLAAAKRTAVARRAAVCRKRQCPRPSSRPRRRRYDLRSHQWLAIRAAKKGERDVPHSSDDGTVGPPDAQHHARGLHRRTARPPARWL